MSLQAIRAGLVAFIAAVPGIGIVHSHERYAKDEAKFRDLYVQDLGGGKKVINGWWVRRVATTEYTVDIGGQAIVVHTWRIRGYRALSDTDESELAFDAVIEGIRDAVRADLSLGGVCEPGPLFDNGDRQEGVQVMDVGPVMFAGVLCHSAVLELKTWSYS